MGVLICTLVAMNKAAGCVRSAQYGTPQTLGTVPNMHSSQWFQ